MGNSIRRVQLADVIGLKEPVPGSNNLLCLNIVEFINPDGTPYKPAVQPPPPPPPIDIETPTKLSNGEFVNPSTVYSFETISMIPATFDGGLEPLTYSYRLQEDTGSGWVSLTNWQQGLPTYKVSQSEPGDRLRFQTKANDDAGQTKTSNSPATTVGTTTTIGVLSIAPPNEAADAGTIVVFDALISGDANPIYTWNIRSGPGQIWSGSNIGKQIEVKVDDDATSGSTISVQVTAFDNSASDNPQSTASLIIVN